MIITDLICIKSSFKKKKKKNVVSGISMNLPELNTFKCVCLFIYYAKHIYGYFRLNYVYYFKYYVFKAIYITKV